MAGVAPSRGGSNATTIGMVVAIIVAVLLGGVLIWLYTLQEQLRADARQAIAARARLAARADEATAKALFPDASSSKKTLVGEMNRGVQLLLRRLSGDQNQTPQDAVARLDAVLEEISTEEKVPDPSALSSAYGASTIIQNLYDFYVAERDLRAKAEQTLEETRTGLKEALATQQKLKSRFDSRLEKAQSNLAAVQKAMNELEDLKSDDLKSLARKVEASRLALIEARKARARLRGQFRTEAARLQSLIAEQAAALGRRRGPAPANAQPLAAARIPVGRIMHAIPGSALVHINLGREDNVSLGMTFSVYSSDERIPADGRGKASIEVAHVGQRTSECRVVSPPSPDDPILEGDVVGNIILSRNRSRQRVFCVVGDFDTDFDGQPDARGRENIASLIRRSGGKVVDRVDAMTDFVVVGLEPPGYDVVAPVEPVEPATEEPEAADGAKAREDEEETDEEDDEDEEWGDDEDEEWDEDEDEEWDEDEDEEWDEDEDEEWDEDEDEEDEEWDEDEDDEDEDDEDEGDDDADEDEEDEEADEDDEDAGDDDDADEDNGEDDFSPGDAGPGADLTPVAPRIERKTEVDPTVSVRERRYRSEAERYRDALRRARAFHVPLLTQEQFFNFIGIEGTVSDIRRLQG